MRNKNTAGTEALRYSVFMPDMDANAQARHDRYVGSQYDLSIVIRHQGVHHMPGGREEPRVCYEIYMHDEHTPAGTLIADSCQLPEYYLDETTLDVDDETITLTMNDGWEFVLDLKPILEKYLVNITHLESGEVVLYQHFDEEGNPQERGRWVNGSTYSLDPETGILTVTAPNGTSYDVDTTGRLTFGYNPETRLFGISLRGGEAITFQNGDIVDASVVDDVLSITIAKPGEEPVTVTYQADRVTFADNGDGTYTITVNGTPTTFATGGDTVVFADEGNGDYRLTINGTPHEFNTGVSLVEAQGNGVFQATNADGTIVQWFGEYVPGTLYLQDPVIFIDQATGSSNPPVTEQGDLATARFNSFNAVWNFLTTCIVQGTLTINAVGTFNDPQPNLIKVGGATLTTIQATGGDHTALVFNWNRDSDSFRHGFAALDGVRARLGNCTIRAAAGTASPWASAISAQNPGTYLDLFGTILVESASVADTAATNYILQASEGAEINSRSTNVSGVPNLTLDLNLAAGAVLRTFSFCNRAGVISLSDCNIILRRNITVGQVIRMNGSSRFTFGEGTNQLYEPRFTGPGEFNGDAFRIEGGSYLRFVRIDAVSASHASVQAFVRAIDPSFLLDRASYVLFGDTVRFGTSGTDYS